MIQKGRLFSLQPANLKPGRVHCNKYIISARRPFGPLSRALLLLRHRWGLRHVLMLGLCPTMLLSSQNCVSHTLMHARRNADL